MITGHNFVLTNSDVVAIDLAYYDTYTLTKMISENCHSQLISIQVPQVSITERNTEYYNIIGQTKVS